MKITRVVQSTDLPTIKNEILTRLVPHSFFGISGAMGAGKTTLIVELFKDDKVRVSSPTFALYNSYAIKGMDVVHVDLYRLTSSEDVDSSGFWDLFADTRSVILTEWVERIDWSEVPLDWTAWSLTIQVKSDEQRLYSLFSINR